MKRILINEKQYKRLVHLLNEQHIIFRNKEDEKDTSHEILATLVYLTGIFKEKNIKKDIFVDKIEDGIVYLDAKEYTSEEISMIEKAISDYIKYGTNPRDKILKNDLGFDSGIDTDGDNDIADVDLDNNDVADIEDDSDVADIEDDSDVAVIEDEDEKVYKEIEACNFGINSKGKKRKVILPPAMDIRFYQDILKKLGTKVTCQKMLFFFAWRDGESSESTYNPFATTHKDSKNEGCYYNCLKNGVGYTPTDCRTCPSGTVPGVRNYKTYDSGLNATVETLTNGRYPNVVRKLKNDNITALEIASEKSELRIWGTGGLVHDILRLNNTLLVNRIAKPDGNTIVEEDCTLTTNEYKYFKEHIRNKKEGDAFRRWVNSDETRLNNINRKLSNCEKFSGLELSGEVNDYVELAFKYKGKEWVKLGKPGVGEEVVDSKKDTELRNKIIKYAETKLGEPYIWGKEFDGKGGDCSGLIDNVLRNVPGITSPYNGRETSAVLKKLVLGKNVGKKSGLKKGDILVFNPRAGGKIGHVGFVHNVNNDGTVDMIHASSGNGVIVQKNIFKSGLAKRYYGALPIVNGRYESSSSGNLGSKSDDYESPDSRNDENDCPNYDCWTYFGKESFWDGKNKVNNITVPKITIKKSTDLFKITYKGVRSGLLLKHGNGGKNDTIHQLLNVLTLELNKYLKENYLKPVVKSIKMNLVGNSLTVEVPLVNSVNKKYIIDRRGSLGGKIDDSGLKKYENMDGYEVATHVSDDLKEKFVTVITSKEEENKPPKVITQPKKGSKITIPTKARLTSAPTANRWGRPHHGYDIVGPYSGYKCLIVCNKPGVVTYAGRCGGYGNLVEIRHNDGTYSAYAHLHKIYLVGGQKVNIGVVIGIEGNTGGSMGRHLHFEERVKRPKGKKNRCGEGSPYNEVIGYINKQGKSLVKPVSNLNNYFYFQELG